MKKLIFILPFVLIACKKEAPVANNPANSDSVTAIVKTAVPTETKSRINKDSLIANSAAVEKVLDEGVNRDVNDGDIVRTADASMLPFTIGDQFTKDDQKFILKIKNVSISKLKITVDSREPMNIRINQIKKPDGSFQGPFSKTLNLDTPQKGEYWVILGKSNMANGNTKGHFSIKVQ